MSIAHQLRQLARDLRTQKLRTLLTVFGIVWGTVSVSLLLSFGEGLHEQVYENSAGIGENIVIAWPSRTSIAFEGIGKGRSILLTERDTAMIRQEAQLVENISCEYREEMQVRWQDRTLAVDIHGVEPEFGEMRNLIPELGGRFLNALDEQGRRRVGFIGDEIAEELFGDVDPVGKSVLVGGSPFTIVGLLKHKEQDSNYAGRDAGKIYVPASTLRAISGRKYMNNFIVKGRSAGETPDMRAEILELLARKHRFDPQDREALMIWDTTGMFEFLDTFMLAFRLFLGVVGSLTLVVGGIGVSNIMNVVVEERTQEIGIKMALGARPRAIMGQFMLECAFVTVVGGALGLAIAWAVCSAFPVLGLGPHLGTPVISPQVGIVTASLLGLLAMVAGWFPARVASRLDPAIAMKME